MGAYFFPPAPGVVRIYFVWEVRPYWAAFGLSHTNCMGFSAIRFVWPKVCVFPKVNKRNKRRGIYEALGTKISHPAHAENSPKRRREVFGYLLVYSPPPLARAKFEHFYPESKGDRDTVFKRIPICVQPAQNRQIDWGEPDD